MSDGTGRMPARVPLASRSRPTIRPRCSSSVRSGASAPTTEASGSRCPHRTGARGVSGGDHRRRRLAVCDSSRTLRSTLHVRGPGERGFTARAAPASDVRVLSADPCDGRRMWAGTWGEGVFVSADSGVSRSDFGLQTVRIRTMASDRWNAPWWHRRTRASTRVCIGDRSWRDRCFQKGPFCPGVRRR